MTAKTLPRRAPARSWTLTERKPDGTVQPLMFCDDERLTVDIARDLRRRGCNVDALEAVDTTTEPTWR